MGDDRLMVLGDRLFHGQTRLAYFLLTVDASAVVLTLTRFEDAPRRGLWLLLLAIASWVGAFYLGVMYLVNTNGVILANIQRMKTEEGTHELIPPERPDLRKLALGRLLGTLKMWRDRASSSAAWHMRLIVVGAALYASWLINLKRLWRFLV